MVHNTMSMDIKAENRGGTEKDRWAIPSRKGSRPKKGGNPDSLKSSSHEHVDSLNTGDPDYDVAVTSYTPSPRQRRMSDILTPPENEMRPRSKSFTLAEKHKGRVGQLRGKERKVSSLSNSLECLKLPTIQQGKFLVEQNAGVTSSFGTAKDDSEMRLPSRHGGRKPNSLFDCASPGDSPREEVVDHFPSKPRQRSRTYSGEDAKVLQNSVKTLKSQLGHCDSSHKHCGNNNCNIFQGDSCKTFHSLNNDVDSSDHGNNSYDYSNPSPRKQSSMFDVPEKRKSVERERLDPPMPCKNAVINITVTEDDDGHTDVQSQRKFFYEHNDEKSDKSFFGGGPFRKRAQTYTFGQRLDRLKERLGKKDMVIRESAREAERSARSRGRPAALAPIQY